MMLYYCVLRSAPCRSQSCVIMLRHVLSGKVFDNLIFVILHRYADRDVDKGGARGATAPLFGVIFTLKYLKKEAKLGKKLVKMVESKMSAPPLEGLVSTCMYVEL